MIAIRALDGTDVVVNEEAVTLVVGPYPHDVGAHTYVHGVERGVLVTAEAAAALATRLGVDPPLVRLTRPDGSPVWIKKLSITAVRPPSPREQQAGDSVKAVVVIGGLQQAVREDAQTVAGMLIPPAASGSTA